MLRLNIDLSPKTRQQTHEARSKAIARRALRDAMQRVRLEVAERMRSWRAAGDRTGRGGGW